MRNIIISLFLMVLVSCASTTPKATAYVLEYRDFGPPVIASDLIGMDWWQWKNHGDSRPKEYDIKVVVYKNIDLVEIKKLYPVVASELQDYRYVKYHDALKYLDEHIADKVIEEVTNTLIDTKNKIISSMSDE